MGSAEVGYEFGNKGKRVLVANSDVINASVVLYWPQLSVPLFDKEERGGIWRLRWAYIAFCMLLLDEVF